MALCVSVARRSAELGVPSSTPVTVTVCAAAQVVGLNVSAAGVAVATAVSLLVTETVTVPAGWTLSVTPYSAVPPSATVTEVTDRTSSGSAGAV